MLVSVVLCRKTSCRLTQKVEWKSQSSIYLILALSTDVEFYCVKVATELY